MSRRGSIIVQPRNLEKIAKSMKNSLPLAVPPASLPEVASMTGVPIVGTAEKPLATPAFRAAEALIDRYIQINRDFAQTIDGHEEAVALSLSLENLAPLSPQITQKRCMTPGVPDRSRTRIMARTYLRKVYTDVVVKLTQPPARKKRKAQTNPLAGTPYKLSLPAITFRSGIIKIRPVENMRKVEAAFESFEIAARK
eukprot:GEMP01056708.1.p1 GENE.GEMP01056708.1~~GEMP01056708.1.p1  ORF type:complete len:197 (+),score=36.71 GEMP01056708.1:56-646(+)